MKKSVFIFSIILSTILSSCSGFSGAGLSGLVSLKPHCRQSETRICGTSNLTYFGKVLYAPGIFGKIYKISSQSEKMSIVADINDTGYRAYGGIAATDKYLFWLFMDSRSLV